MMGSQSIISISGLSFSYKGPHKPVFEALSVDIPAGSVTAILGPNGSGKTTLLHLILGFLQPERGRIELAGRPHLSYTRQEMGRLMTLLPQREHIAFNFSALEYVLLGRAPYLRPLQTPQAADRRIAHDALDTVGAGFLRHRPVAAMSGGEQQLVLLARALAQQPRILLMDEPTSHLDLSNQGRILHLMRCLSATGVTVIFSTHDPNAAAAAATHVVLMRQGRVLATAPTVEALTRERLSATYDVAVEVLQAQGRTLIYVEDT